MVGKLLVALAGALAAAHAAEAAPPLFDFQGRHLAVLSDGDMVASAYIDGELGPPSPQGGDALTVFSLAGGTPREVARVPVSNSVTAWPNSLALTPDGRFALVAELARPRGAATRLAALEGGRGLAVVDLRDPAAARVARTLELPATAVAVAAHPGGGLVAVALREEGRARLALLAVGADGALGEPRAVDLPGGRTEGPADIVWHPAGGLLAATYPGSFEVAFYRLSGDGFAEHGPPVRTGEPGPGRVLGVGRFTPAGDQFLVTDLRWAVETDADHRAHPPGEIVAVAVGDGARPAHRIAARARTGYATEEFALSPDGRWVVGLDMERSYAPAGDPRRSRHSALTLIRRDPATGAMERVGQFPFEGVLPEGIAFDASGRHVAVAVFDQPAPYPSRGRLDLWRLEPGSANEPPLLVKAERTFAVPRGAHIVKLAR